MSNGKRVLLKFSGAIGLFLGIWLSYVHQPWANMPSLFAFGRYLAAPICGFFLDRPWQDSTWRRRVKRGASLVAGFLALMTFSTIELWRLPMLMALNWGILTIGFWIRGQQLAKRESLEQGVGNLSLSETGLETYP